MIKKLNKFLLAILLALMTMPAQAIDASSPDKLVKTLTDKVVAKLKQNRSYLDNNPEAVIQVARQLAATINPHWDRVRTSAYIIGKPWRKSSRTDKKTFISEFENLLIRTYSNALLKYADQRIEYLPYRHRGGNTANVRSKFIQSGGPPINITYSLYKHKTKGWRVFNVKVGGFDLIANFRSQYSPVVRKSGLAGLNKTLQARP